MVSPTNYGHLLTPICGTDKLCEGGRMEPAAGGRHPNEEADMPKPGSQAKPSPKQLRYLKVLADQRGESFTYPKTIAAASAEIDRLRKRKPSSRVDRYIDRKAVDEALGSRGGAARMRETETGGYGSTAHWTERG